MDCYHFWLNKNNSIRQQLYILCVNFTNILRVPFMCADPKSAKRYWQLDWIFTLLGSASVKASREHIGGIDPTSPLSIFVANNSPTICEAIRGSPSMTSRKLFDFYPLSYLLYTIVSINLETISFDIRFLLLNQPQKPFSFQE